MKRFNFIAAAWVWSFTTGAYAAEQPGTAAAGGVFQVLLGLLFVLGLMAAVAWALKRFGVARANGGAPVKIVGGVSLGGRERVLVIEAADQWIVLGVAPGRVNALATMPRQEGTASMTATPAAKNFASWLKQTRDKRNAK